MFRFTIHSDDLMKVPRPDGRPDSLGLYVLDQPYMPENC